MSHDVSAKEALVLGRCGKLNGKNKYWINVEHPDKTLEAEAQKIWKV